MGTCRQGRGNGHMQAGAGQWAHAGRGGAMGTYRQGRGNEYR